MPNSFYRLETRKSNKGWEQDTEIKTPWRTRLSTAGTITKKHCYFGRSKRQEETKFTYCLFTNLLLQMSLCPPSSCLERFYFIMLFLHKQEVGLCSAFCHLPWQSLTIQAEGSEIVKNTFSVLSALPVRLLKGVLTKCTKRSDFSLLFFLFFGSHGCRLIARGFFFRFHLILLFFPSSPDYQLLICQ